MNKLIEIHNLAEEEAKPLGLCLVESRIMQQGKRRTLEITIHRPGSRVSLQDCEELSRKLEQRLDQQSPPLLEGPYNLEIQSPGLDRQLKSERDFELFADEQIEIKTREKIEGLGDHFQARLASLRNGFLYLQSPSSMPDKDRRSKKKKAKNPEIQLPADLQIEWTKILQVRLFSDPALQMQKEPDLSHAESMAINN